jgi:hypothetical protein
LKEVILILSVLERVIDLIGNLQSNLDNATPAEVQKYVKLREDVRQLSMEMFRDYLDSLEPKDPAD